jgi:hypothetical protein
MGPFDLRLQFAIIIVTDRSSSQILEAYLIDRLRKYRKFDDPLMLPRRVGDVSFTCVNTLNPSGEGWISPLNRNGTSGVINYLFLRLFLALLLPYYTPRAQGNPERVTNSGDEEVFTQVIRRRQSDIQ